MGEISRERRGNKGSKTNNRGEFEIVKKGESIGGVISGGRGSGINGKGESKGVCFGGGELGFVLVIVENIGG